MAGAHSIMKRRLLLQYSVHQHNFLNVKAEQSWGDTVTPMTGQKVELYYS